MAQIDLRNAVIRIKDGYTGPGGTPLVNKPTATSDLLGAVNNVAGYAAGATTMLVSSFTGAVSNGDTFLVAGDTVHHKITAHSETLGATTSITFTPALGAAVVDTAVITIAGGYIAGETTILVDGFSGEAAVGDLFSVAGDTVTHRITAETPTLGNTTSITFTPALGAYVADNAALTMLPHQLDVEIADGNLTYSEKRNFKYILNRGSLNTVRQEDDVPVDVKIDAIWEFLRASSGSGTPTIEDALKQRGEASGWISSSDDPCEVYAVDVEVEYDPPCTGEEREIITLGDFRWEDFQHDLKQGMLSVSGKCNVTQAVVLRTA